MWKVNADPEKAHIQNENKNSRKASPNSEGNSCLEEQQAAAKCNSRIKPKCPLGDRVTTCLGSDSGCPSMGAVVPDGKNVELHFIGAF